MFADCRVALEDYVVALQKHGMSVRADHLLQEVRARLRQLEWVYARLMKIEVELTEAVLKLMPTDTSKPAVIKQVFTEASAQISDPATQAQLSFQLSDELRVLLEAFYYSAHRVRDILRDHKADLPGITGFEAVGVRNVRNHLVEHPSRKNGVLVPSAACGGPVGPQLRLLRWSLDPAGTHDQGLPFNAREFTDALHSCLDRATHAIATYLPETRASGHPPPRLPDVRRDDLPSPLTRTIPPHPERSSGLLCGPPLPGVQPPFPLVSLFLSQSL